MRVTPRRSPANPIVTPAMVPPSRPDLRVVGAFNPAAIRRGDETLLLLRVAEAPRENADDEVAAPVFDPATGDLVVRRWRRDAPGVDAGDPRLIVADGSTWLTSISHLRLARSTDGEHFTIDPAAALGPVTGYETFGVEDGRITELAGTYWINYTAVSPRGIATALASTRDFHAYERHGVIFAPNNRDVTIFPERIDGRFAALHRPMPSFLGTTSIWFATSPDLRAWGEHRVVAEPRPGMWDGVKIGGGAVPFRVTHAGRDAWLAVYHGVTGDPHVYALGALLLDGREPWRVLGRSREPIMAPEAPYETSGFFSKVVFTCGLVSGSRPSDLGSRPRAGAESREPGAGTVRVYYGAADGVTAVADLSVDEILAGLE